MLQAARSVVANRQLSPKKKCIKHISMRRNYYCSMHVPILIRISISILFVILNLTEHVCEVHLEF